jgi:hypothetical protein
MGAISPLRAKRGVFHLFVRAADRQLPWVALE